MWVCLVEHAKSQMLYQGFPNPRLDTLVYLDHHQCDMEYFIILASILQKMPNKYRNGFVFDSSRIQFASHSEVPRPDIKTIQ